MRMYTREQVTAPKPAASFRTVVDVQTEPVTLEEAWWHLRIDDGGGPNDDWVDMIGIPAARQWCEQYTGLSIAKRTYEVMLDGFGGGIELPRGPVSSVVSVVYLDQQGATQTLDQAKYALDAFAVPAMLRPAFSVSWPVAQSSPGSVRVRYTTGFSLQDDSPQTYPLPPSIRVAILQMVAHLFLNREADALPPNYVCSLLDLHRVRLGMA